jgi:hypothetical protein
MSLGDPSSEGVTWQLAGAKFLLRIPGLARFLLADGKSITFEPENGTAPDEIAVFLSGSVFGMLLHQRGNIVLHASAVAVGGKAVLFCGASGAGKSTLAAALNRAGCAVVADDVCAVTIGHGSIPVVQSDGRMIKLWAEAVEHLDLAERRSAPVRAKLQKYYVESDAERSTALALGAIYVLRDARPPLAEGIEAVNIVDAATLLRRNAYRPALVKRMGQREMYFRAAAAMTAAAGVFHLTRPLVFARLPDTIAMLQRHWRQIGLMKDSESVAN